jgi:hypothetical protein
MNKLIKALLFALPLALMGCADEYDTTVSTAGYPALGVVNNGCIVVNDEAFGEREICSQYYMSNGGYVWWDAAYSMWISPYGYYQGGVWRRGYPVGYQNFYHGYYHPRGFFAGHGYLTGHGGYAPRGFRGNGWHGGGGGHFGGHGGGHR